MRSRLLLRLVFASVIALPALPACAQIPFTGSKVVDAAGDPANGTMQMCPVTTAGLPIAFKLSGGGTTTAACVPVTVTNGAFSTHVPDVWTANPQNACIKLSFQDPVTYTEDLPYYTCLQPSNTAGSPAVAAGWCTAAGSCDLDNYVNGMAPLSTEQLSGGSGGTAFTGGTVADATTFGSSITWNNALRLPGENLNSLTTCGYYDGADLINAPSALGNNFAEIQVVCSDDPLYLWQFVYDMQGLAGHAWWYRYLITGTWSAWTQVPAGSYTLPGASPSALGGVELPTGQSSTTLATVAITGAAADLSGLAGAVNSLPSLLPIPQQKYGKVLYDKSSWSALTDFTVTGTTPSLSNGSIVLAGSASFDGERLGLNSPATADDDTDFQVILTVNTVPNGSADGIFLGRNAFTGNYVSLTGEVIFGSASTQLKFWQQATGTPGTPLATQSASTNGVAVGDTVSVLWSQRGATITLTVQDVTKGWTQQYAITSTLGPDTTTNFHIPATSTFVLGGLGASYNVNRIRIVDQQSQSPFLTVFGDSKVAGGGATSDQTRWASMLGFGPADIEGGPGDETAQLLDAVPFIISQHPQNVLLSMGSNDIRNSVPSATWQANYSSIVSQLKAAGIRVIHLLPIPENIGGGGVDQSALKTWIQTTFASDPQIDPSVGWSTSVDVAADGVHPSPAGHQFLANMVSTSSAFAGAPANPAISSLLPSMGASMSPYSSPGFNVSADAGSSTYTQETLNGNNSDGGRIGLVGGTGTADPNLYIDVPAGGTYIFRVDGTPVAHINSSGVLNTATGGGYTSPGFNVSADASSTTYTQETLNGNNSDGSRIGLVGGTTDPNLYIDVPSGGDYVFRVNNVPMATLDQNGHLSTAATVLSATSSAWTPGLITAGDCVESSTGSGDVTVTGATTGMAVVVTPVSEPGVNTTWTGWVVSTNTVRLKLCNAAGGTPNSVAYNVRVIE